MNDKRFVDAQKLGRAAAKSLAVEVSLDDAEIWIDAFISEMLQYDKNNVEALSRPDLLAMFGPPRYEYSQLLGKLVGRVLILVATANVARGETPEDGDSDE